MTDEHRWDMCGRKKVFRTVDEAIEGAHYAFNKYHSIQRYYECPCCGHYHLTTNYNYTIDALSSYIIGT